jgi:WD40 repeat protein
MDESPQFVLRVMAITPVNNLQVPVMVFDLVRDLAGALDAMPHDHPRHRTLQLLDEAIRRDVHFIDRHPTTIFQCLWNTCWWYDSPARLGHLARDKKAVTAAATQTPRPWLALLMESFRKRKDESTPGHRWLRFLRPPENRLGSSQSAVFRGHAGPVLSLAFAGKDLLWSGGDDATVRVWDLGTGLEVACLRGHEGPVHALAAPSDGKTVTSTSADATCVWDAYRWELLGNRPGAPGAGTASVRSPDTKYLVKAAEDDRIGVFAAESGVELRSWEGHEEPFNFGWGRYGATPRCFAFTRDGRLLISGAEDQTVRVWDFATGEAIACHRGHHGTIRSVAVAPDQAVIASGSDDRSIRLWQTLAHEEDERLTNHQDFVWAIEFRPDGAHLATGAMDGLATIWDSRTGQMINQWFTTTCTFCVAYSADGTRLAYGGGPPLFVLDGETGKGLYSMLHGEQAAVALSRDGTRLAAAARGSGRLQLFDPERERLIHEWEGHSKHAVRIAFGPNDDRLISMGEDGLIKVWSADGQKCWDELPRDEQTWRRLTGKAEEAVEAVSDDRSETELRSAQGAPFAWCPEPLSHVRKNPRAWTWAGAASVHLVLFALEGETGHIESGLTARNSAG